MTDPNDLGNDLLAILEDAAGSLIEHRDAVRLYAADRMLHLSTLVGEPGYLTAVRAEADNVVLEAGLVAVDAADGADRELWGIVAGFLVAGARVLA